MSLPIRMFMCSHVHMLLVHMFICHLSDVFICYVSTRSYVTCPHAHVAHLFIWSQVSKLICSYVPVYTTTYVTHWSLVTWSHIHLITHCSPVLLYTHVLLVCSRVHSIIVPCVHMACTHDIACSHTHTPMYTHWFTLSHDHRYTCALIRHVYMSERFHMFPSSLPNRKGG